MLRLAVFPVLDGPRIVSAAVLVSSMQKSFVSLIPHSMVTLFPNAMHGLAEAVQEITAAGLSSQIRGLLGVPDRESANCALIVWLPVRFRASQVPPVEEEFNAEMQAAVFAPILAPPNWLTSRVGPDHVAALPL